MLKQELNSSIGNSDFVTKKKEYDLQNVQDHLSEISVTKIMKQEDWNEEIIAKRTAKILKKVLSVLESTEFKSFNQFK